jgi:hypothetical protein
MDFGFDPDHFGLDESLIPGYFQDQNDGSFEGTTTFASDTDDLLPFAMCPPPVIAARSDSLPAPLSPPLLLPPFGASDLEFDFRATCADHSLAFHPIRHPCFHRCEFLTIFNSLVSRFPHEVSET